MEDLFIDIQLIKYQLIQARKDLHMTQSDVARKAGLSLSTISRIESSDDNSILFETLMKYARVVDCKISCSARAILEENEDE